MKEQSRITSDTTAAPAAPAPCRFCGTPLEHVMVDLGMSPLCESYVPPERAHQYEPFYPLVVYVCKKCFLAQVLDYVSAESIFSEYAYFSSFSDSWVRHAEKYTEMAITRFGLTTDSFVVELASNDGYLLQHFVKRSIPVLGIEPAANIAVAAESKGVPTLVRFFGVPVAKELADQGKQADLLVGNNVLAQVPDLNDFVAGMKLLLKPDGVITLEFPHLMRLMEENQFDTIYHEHYSYFSLLTVKELFARHGLRLFDVEEIPTHGGSLRVYACHADCRTHDDGRSVSELGEREIAHGLRTLSHYTAFGRQVEETRYKLLTFLIDLKRQGKSIAGYGAPGKGNTLLNYCGIRSDLISYTVDRNPYKQGKYLPGSRIPIYAPERIEQTKPDFVFILPWNLRNEIMAQLSFIRRWGGQFIVPIPEVRVYS